ncbi:alpha-fetoprotein related protein [Cricetulus griseus]|uniref:Alpha-fetoprotein related protein n=1 Tax=Cricetulus griseus TaxID=10029 RepID=A0A061IMD2_CRIGR|nr:alpha-fetoprotein related protein [Cricetulus griseus]
MPITLGKGRERHIGTCNCESEDRGKCRLLGNLVKQKPHAAEEEFLSIGEDFMQLVEMCCHAEKREMCFQEEFGLS